MQLNDLKFCQVVDYFSLFYYVYIYSHSGAQVGIFSPKYVEGITFLCSLR